jgi:DNA-directed RNA polymerase subunit RPC12/RpoP
MLSGLLSGGGRLVFNYCNKQNAERVAHWLARKKVENPFSRQPAGVGTTVISHHPAAVQSLLAEAGFRRLRSYGTGVLDHVSPRKSFSPGWVTLANGLAPLLAWTRVAPWIVCQADAGDAAGKLAITALDDLLQCPNCAAKVVAEAGGYRCSACGVRYPVEDDIIDFRIDKLELP